MHSLLSHQQLGLLSVLLPFFTTGTPLHSDVNKRQNPSPFSIPGAPPTDDLNAWTTFLNYASCSDQDKKTLIQAQTDAVMLAKVVDTANKDDPNPDRIDWNSAGAVEYFGPPSTNEAFRDDILSVFRGVSTASRGWGWSDWWSQRYVNIACDHEDTTTDCYDNGNHQVAAYTTINKDSNPAYYENITFCGGFFDVLKPHATVFDAVKADKSKQDDVYQLRSQATTFFHELLHLSKGSARICDNCRDQRFYIGPSSKRERVTAYKPGRIKLLAKTAPNGARLASHNNDNYPYYAMAMFMQNEFTNYPAYPQAWNPDRGSGDQDSKSLASELNNDNFEDDPNASIDQVDADYTGILPDSAYPPAYISQYGSVQPPPTSQGVSSSTSVSVPSASAPAPLPAYATGTCSFHLTETQTCVDDTKNLYAVITLKDNNKADIGDTSVNDTSPFGAPINAADPYQFNSKLPNPITVTGEHKNDYVQFTYEGLQWTSRDTIGPATCSNGGWDPRNGPVCHQRFGNQNAANNMDCSFPC